MTIPLLRTRRFLPSFATQALGALNDNLFKNAFVVAGALHAAGPRCTSWRWPAGLCGASMVRGREGRRPARAPVQAAAV